MSNMTRVTPVSPSDPLSPGGLESDGSRETISPGGYSDSTSNSTSHETVDQLDNRDSNRL